MIALRRTCCHGYFKLSIIFPFTCTHCAGRFGADRKMYVPPTAVISRRAFIPNQFPYKVPAGCRHYVLWYAGVGDDLPTDEQVSAHGLDSHHKAVGLTQRVAPTPALLK